MRLPLVSIIGRPNVGKSSLLNRLAETNAAIVHEERGVTRDRTYHKTEWAGVPFILVDTGGIELPSQESDAFSSHIRESATAALAESDVILFMVDMHAGITQEDEFIAQLIKRSHKPVFLLVNKADNPADDSAVYEFYNLGLGDPHAVSALHGHGTGDLLDEIVAALPKSKEEDEILDTVVSIAIVGRPNVGKSTLLNQLSHAELSVVSDILGTTRDPIDTYIEHAGTTYRFIDTAGIKKHNRKLENVDYFSYVRSLRAIDEADICLLVLDAEEGMCEQDQKIANAVTERGCGLVVLLNKFDLVQGDLDKQAQIDASFSRRGQFISWASRINISAETGRACNKIWAAIETAQKHHTERISTARLNDFLQEIREGNYTVSKGRAKLKLLFATQPVTAPPTFVFFCNHPKLVNDTYERYLENRLRERFDFSGTPLRLKFRKNKE